jgi:hypothetical protein
MAATSVIVPRCMAGITFMVAIRAAPSTPNRSFRMNSDSIAHSGGVFTIAGEHAEGAKKYGHG